MLPDILHVAEHRSIFKPKKKSRNTEFIGTNSQYHTFSTQKPLPQDRQALLTRKIEPFVDMLDPVVRLHNPRVLEHSVRGTERTVQMRNRLRNAALLRAFNRFETVFGPPDPYARVGLQKR